MCRPRQRLQNLQRNYQSQILKASQVLDRVADAVPAWGSRKCNSSFGLNSEAKPIERKRKKEIHN